jgi:hypothetical protein
MLSDQTIENMPWIGWFNKKKLAIITVLALLLVEVYAHSYVPMNELSVVPGSQAKADGGEGGPGGSYEFVESNCRWIVKWVRENPSESSPHDGYVWTWIYKVSENTSFLSSSTSMLVSGITARYGTNGSKVFYDIENHVLYENNRTDIRTELFFTENGSYDMTLSLKLKFYQRTPIGILPTGEHTIPMKSTFYVSIG